MSAQTDFNRYFTNDELKSRLEEWEGRYPGLVSLSTIGTSHEKRPIWLVTLTNKDVNGKEPLELVSKSMSDLLVMAWACDLTRVASYMFSGSVNATVFHMLGQTQGNHDLTHDATKQDQVWSGTC